MKRFVLFLIILLALAGILSACGNASAEPVEITLDIDKCYTCHMGIEDLQAAAQSILTDGTPRFFDDIGCMLVYLDETNDDVAISYVKDHLTSKWMDVSKGYFIHDHTIETPMSYGFIAFSSEEAALQFGADHGGELLSSAELSQIDQDSLKEWYRSHTNEHGHSGMGMN